MIITSKSNPIIKDIIKLQSDKKFRIAEMSYIVEGIKPVKECIAAGGDIRKIICTEELIDTFNGAQIVSESVFKAISSEKTPQGVLAIVSLPVNGLQPPKNSCILLDRLQDPGNLGTIIRTANAAGYSEIYAINCTDAYSPKAVRASMSGIFFVKVYTGTCEEILSVLEGVPLICADMSGEDIFNFVPPEKFCLCIGNEGGGLSPVIKVKSQFKVKIPMQETCESLNAAVSAGIAMYQLKYKK
ncbi:MAG: RNA methyltransferase [Clostridiales bacterium]|nr:RNA methyltransferase [Clostridiales bacterium]